MKRLLFFLPFLMLFSGCLKDENLKTENITYLPIAMNDGWEIEPETSLFFDMDIFNDIIRKVYSNDELLVIRSLVVVKNGKLMAEAYPRTQDDRTRPHQLWSTTKSVMALLTGIAYDKGYIRNVSDSVFRYMPEYLQYAYPQLQPLTIEECLTMRSGIDYDNGGWEEEEILSMVPNDLTKYMLERPMKYLPGEVADYKNSDPQLLVKVLANATHTDLVAFAEENLFEPLGITNYFWTRNKDNTPYGGFGLWLTPRDMAKTGQMLLNNGIWKDRRIISAAWLEEATARKTTINGFDYGYYFWIKPNYFFTWGARGQYIFVVPEKDLVVVITSEQFADKGKETSIEEAFYMVERVIESVK